MDADAVLIRVRRLTREILTGKLPGRQLRATAGDLAAQVRSLDDHLAGGGPPPVCWLPPDERPLPWE